MKSLRSLKIIIAFSFFSQALGHSVLKDEDLNTAIKNSHNVPGFRLGNNPMLQYKMDDLSKLHFNILREEIERQEKRGRHLNFYEQEKISKKLKEEFEDYLKAHDSPADLLRASEDFRKSLKIQIID